MSVRTAGIHGPQVRRRAERLADPTIVECPHPAEPEARFRRGKLRIGRRNGRILQAKQLRAAAAILGLDAPHVGKEHEHHGGFGDEVLPERSLGQQSFGFPIP
jgi:hypothetical protein